MESTVTTRPEHKCVDFLFAFAHSTYILFRDILYIAYIYQNVLETGEHSNSSDDEFDKELTSVNCSLLKKYDIPSNIQFSLSPSVNDYEGQSCILSLPFNVLVSIFKYLPIHDLLHNIPLVCQLWYFISLSSDLRTRLYVRRNAPVPVLVKLISTRPALRVLHLAAFEQANSVLVDAIKLCPHLECLNIGFCSLSDEVAYNLALHLPPSLLHLNVEGVSVIEKNFVNALVEKCSKLEALNMSHCVSVCDSCIKMLTRLCHLRRLNLDGVLWISDGGLMMLAQSQFIQSGTLNAIWLDGFELSNAGLLEFVERLVDVDKKIVYSYPSNHLDLSKFSSFFSTSRGMGIHLLWISFCDHIEDNAIISIAKLSNLIALTLRKAHQVTSRALSMLFTFSRNNYPLSAVGDTSFLITDLNSTLNEPSLKWLEHLDLSEASGVVDSVLSDICKCCGNRLRSLLLNWCWELTDKSVEQIVDVCHSLRQLSLVGNSLIKGHAFVHVPINQPNLILLNLTQCSHVSDNILEEVSLRMPSLYVFDFFGERVGAHDFNDICHFDLSRMMGKVPICSH